MPLILKVVLRSARLSFCREFSWSDAPENRAKLVATFSSIDEIIHFVESNRQYQLKGFLSRSTLPIMRVPPSAPTPEPPPQSAESVYRRYVRQVREAETEKGLDLRSARDCAKDQYTGQSPSTMFG
jgi:hypothetical protein